MQLQTEVALIEAILFLESDPVETGRLIRISKLSRTAVVKALSQLEELYREDTRGIELVCIGDSWQLAPKRLLWQQLKERYGKRGMKKLSKAAMETLTIIAYRQPITRNEIEVIRGVSSDPMIKLLLTQKLIKEVGRKNVLGKPVQYGTTLNFLKVVRLSSIAELPKLDEIEQSRFDLRKDN